MRIEDKLVWHYNPNGDYSVSWGNELALQFKRNGLVGRRPGYGVIKPKRRTETNVERTSCGRRLYMVRLSTLYGSFIIIGNVIW